MFLCTNIKNRFSYFFLFRINFSVYFGLYLFRLLWIQPLSFIIASFAWCTFFSTPYRFRIKQNCRFRSQCWKIIFESWQNIVALLSIAKNRFWIHGFSSFHIWFQTEFKVQDTSGYIHFFRIALLLVNFNIFFIFNI